MSRISGLSYLIIYMAPIYYLAYYYPNIDYGMMLAVTCSIVFCGLMLGFNMAKWLKWLIIAGVVYLLYRLAAGFYNVISVVNYQYLTFKLGSYLIITLFYFVVITTLLWKKLAGR